MKPKHVTLKKGELKLETIKISTCEVRKGFFQEHRKT